MEFPPNSCYLATDWWWQTDRTVEFPYVRPGGSAHYRLVYIPQLKDGSIASYHISAA
ncbi:hypothetical protein [Streptomyces sp. T028]|uniref:hypothetical protein n=1 Tax=Streptomyces sp. T028 TaxID=3394379 RepID=UPI003A8B9A4D